jgi:hypothetical protein
LLWPGEAPDEVLALATKDPPLALNVEYPAAKLVEKPDRLGMVTVLFTARKNCQRRDLLGNMTAALDIS